MKIKQSVLDQINNPQSRNRLGSKLGTGEQAIYRQLKENNPNGRLTKMDALEAISEETGLPIDQILEESAEPVGEQK